MLVLVMVVPENVGGIAYYKVYHDYGVFLATKDGVDFGSSIEDYFAYTIGVCNKIKGHDQVIY